jgi:hypothetical protein
MNIKAERIPKPLFDFSQKFNVADAAALSQKSLVCAF